MVQNTSKELCIWGWGAFHYSGFGSKVDKKVEEPKRQGPLPETDAGVWEG